MEGILKQNDVATIGGTTPQGEGVEVLGQIGDWIVVSVDDKSLSSVQEFNIQPVEDGFVDAVNGPQDEGAYNAEASKIEGFGDKMRFETNPGQVTVGVEDVPDGTSMSSPDDRDDQSQKNFTSEDAAPYKNAWRFIKKYDAKSVLRNQIRGKIVDVEDDIADTKIALQMALYYFANEWNGRTPAQKNANKNKVSMDTLTAKLLSDDVKMRADLSNGIDSINDIVEKEVAINKFVSANYSYPRGT